MPPLKLDYPLDPTRPGRRQGKGPGGSRISSANLGHRQQGAYQSLAIYPSIGAVTGTLCVAQGPVEERGIFCVSTSR